MAQSKKGLAELAIIVGYDKEDNIVYDETMSLDEYYDGAHLWDDNEKISKIGLVRIQGKLYGPEGKLFQDFESAFSKQTGEYIGDKTVYDDGTTNTDGIYEKNG